jgi:hypothetical protein
MAALAEPQEEGAQDDAEVEPGETGTLITTAPATARITKPAAMAKTSRST